MAGRFLTLLTVLILATAMSAAAQTGSVHNLVGKVTDAGGAALPGVTVELTNPASNDSIRTVRTDAEGSYRIDRVVPGVYVLTFGLRGFGTVIRDIEIGAGGDDFEFDVQLKPLLGNDTKAAPGPRRRVVCGMTVISPPPNVDPGIRVPTPPPGAQQAKPTIRAIQPTLCWEPSSSPPPVQAK